MNTVVRVAMEHDQLEVLETSVLFRKDATKTTQISCAGKSHALEFLSFLCRVSEAKKDPLQCGHMPTSDCPVGVVDLAPVGSVPVRWCCRSDPTSWCGE